jgi:NhaC family Na+:H+ antiporter
VNNYFMDKKRPTIFLALLPIVVLITLLALNINFFEDPVAGPNQIALLFASAIAGVIAFGLGRNWVDIRKQIVKSIGDAMPSILILLLIGSLAGTWMLSGVVPTLIYYGLDVLHPSIFLFASVVISAVVSVATGSSWSTIATIGVALLGIGTAMGFDPALVAGAIISGAYFGDKMSPLSDTTNLAPAMAGTDLFTHIKYMVYTTAPSIGITLIIFFVLGFVITPSSINVSVNDMLQAIDSRFFISPVLLLVPVILVILIVKKMPPLPALFIGTLLGAVFALIFQQDLLLSLSESKSFSEASYKVIFQSMFGDLTIPTNNESISKLLSTGGMQGMLNTIWLILTAMVFSGVMESAGLLVRIAEGIVSFAKSTGSLVASTVVTSLFMNITASEQYISIVVPGRMYADIYRKKGLKPEVLSRTLEDGGTVTSVLIPWNTCGAVQSSVLKIPTLDYAPYVFFSIISPLMTIFFAYANIKIRRYSDKTGYKVKTTVEKI